jgi:hypothetical protein
MSVPILDFKVWIVIDSENLLILGAGDAVG